jgi:hypothetical protein
MRFWISLEVLVVMVLLCFVSAPNVSASDMDQKTIVTFSGPVEIPGKALGPGTYVFKVLDVTGTRDVIQVLDKDEKHVYATFLGIPVEMSKPPEKPIIRFKEQTAGAPPAIEAWFYPGRTDGHEFVYPREHAAELAKANNQSVAAMPNNLASNTTELSNSTTPPSSNDKNDRSVVEMENATVDRVTPEDNEVEVTKVLIARLIPVTDELNVQTDSSHGASRELPKTASELPLLAFLGALSVAAGLALRLLARQPA